MRCYVSRPKHCNQWGERSDPYSRRQFLEVFNLLRMRFPVVLVVDVRITSPNLFFDFEVGFARGQLRLHAAGVNLATHVLWEK